ncbi:MAG: NAD(P)/FAD-dependent oxidoreductase [Chlamydiota bacterium]|nr:NAD(P)/FAD-dependent oxidoreductase [Chlamydiota bacterium]
MTNKVVIIGGGFGGLNCAKRLKDANADVIVMDRNNHHTFQPLLYQVATAALSPANIAVPIREILRKHDNTTVFLCSVESIDKENHTITASNGQVFDFDYLVVATGARHSYFGNPEWEMFAPGLKTLPDAIRIREKILLSFEIAERCNSIEMAEKFLRFVIVGGGPTGVELAGAVAEISHKTLFRNFRRIHPENAQIYLIESQPEVLKTFDPRLGKTAHAYLESMGVKVITGTRVSNITQEGVWIGDEFFPSFSIIWAAGNHASELIETLNTPMDRAMRAIVGPDLSIPGHPEIFVIGDSAHAADEDENPLPGIASVAMQQGQYVAKIIANQTPLKERKPFLYFDKGSMATIGQSKAVATIHNFHFTGLFAWLAWSFIHVLYLISFRNRLLVMTQWFFSYLTGSRQVRIILKSVFGREDAIFHKVDDHYESEKGEYHFRFDSDTLNYWDPENAKKTNEKP